MPTNGGLARRRSCRIQQGLHDVSAWLLVDESRCLHIAGNTRITIDPPCSSKTSLSIEYSELIEAQLLLQSTAQSNARLSSANDNDWIVGVCILLISFNDVDGIREVRHTAKGDIYGRK